MKQIESVLTQLFKKNRIVFWYDTKSDLQQQFTDLELPGVKKVVIDNNQFGLKYRLLRAEPERKFLLYQAGPKPADLDNWLLDIELASGQFRADQNALWLSEVGLGLEFVDDLEPHINFFRSAERRQALKQRLNSNDGLRQIKFKMMAVCTDAEPDLYPILQSLLHELAQEQTTTIRLLTSYQLDHFLWQELERTFHYQSETKTMADFALALFQSSYQMYTGGEARLSNDALAFLKQWKSNVHYQESFAILADRSEDDLDIARDIHRHDLATLAEIDFFQIVDKVILTELTAAIKERTISLAECQRLLRQRRRSHWYSKYEHLYQALNAAAHFIDRLQQASLGMLSLVEGIDQYVRNWYQLDQYYRHFIYHLLQVQSSSLLDGLAELVENLYSNNYLLEVNNRWQQIVDQTERWSAPPIRSQQDFYQSFVQPFLAKNKKIYVIISDGLRYEAGVELVELIRQEDRYSAEIDPLLTVLPSFTSLGMAALLPQQNLTLTEKGEVLADGQKTAGTQYRAKILAQIEQGKGLAIKAKDFLNLNHQESRQLTREHDLIYIYHNHIDAVGDQRKTEGRTVEAVAESLQQLVTLIKKLTNANANNIIITADHGFIYQHRVLAESDFLGQRPQGDSEVINRRFVIGRQLRESSSFKRFTASQVGLSGEVEILLPKSINRLRVKGAGSRYVHGGAALQEIVVPVIQINKKRQSDLKFVEVDILRSSNSIITTGQFTAAFYQTTPVTAKKQARTLQAGLYRKDGQLISDEHELTFDFSSEDPRQREMQVQFILTKAAEEANGEEVYLQLQEPVPNTSHYKRYKSARYLIRRAFTTDFDF